MIHNNFDKKYKLPFGAVKQGTEIYLRIDVDKEYKQCFLRLWTTAQKEQRYKMNYVDGYYEINFPIEEVGLNWYFFILEDFNDNLKFYGSDYGYTAGTGIEYSSYPHKGGFQITCYKKDFSIPSWFSGGIMYQIFPDRFARDYTHKFNTEKYKFIHDNWDEPVGHTNCGADNFEYYGGNISGIINKIEYLKSLSINKIYINPIFKSKSNHRYDVSTYLEIDEMIGLIDDFKKLIELCHKDNIKVIIDVSWNHVGDDSIYFNKYKTFGEDGAYNNKNSNYRDWFYIKDNNEYVGWWGIETLPVLNKYNQNLRKHIEKAVEFWTSLGIDGFRLDVIDELPDQFLEWFRVTVKNINKDIIIMGEVWDDATLKKDSNGAFRSFLYGNSQDSVMNYCLRNLVIDFLAYGCSEKETLHYNIDGVNFYKRYMNILNNYPIESLHSMMNFLSTHDVNRILTVFSECPYSETLTKEEQGKFVLTSSQYDIGIKRLKIAWSFMLCSIGIPSIFYGDEIGMCGYNDPFNRNPMKWNLDKDNMDMLNWFKDINSLRVKHEVLNAGGTKFLYFDTDVIAFSRYNDSEELIYIMNRSTEARDIIIGDHNIHINGLGYEIIINHSDMFCNQI